MEKDRKKFGIFKITAIVVIVLVAILAALPFLIDADRFRPQLVSIISTALGREVSLGKLKLSLLSGSIVVESISIADDPEYSPSPFVTANSLKIAVEMKPLIFSRSIRISGITLDRPSITLIRSQSGKWNFSNLGGKKGSEEPAPAQEEGFSGKDVTIRELKVTGGKVTMIHSGESRKPSVYEDVNLTARNLSYSTSFPFSLSATLPGSGSLKLDGQAGPLSDVDLMTTPASADVEVKRFDLIASGFVPPESGLRGVIDFTGNMNSDGRQVRSKGRASADKLQVSTGGSPAGRPVSLEYAIDHDLTLRRGTVSDAMIGCGKALARLKGSYEMQGSSVFLKMSLQGSGMPVEDLTALLPALGITLPKGASLHGGALDTSLATEGPLEKLVTSGNVTISGTRLAGFDLSGKMAALATLAGIRSNQDTEIEKFASGLRLAPEGIQVKDLVLIVPALGRMSGSGSIAEYQSLDFVMQASLKPGGAIGTGLARLVRGGALDIPFYVRGTALEPKFVPDARKAAGNLLGTSFGQDSKEDQPAKSDKLGDTLRNLLQKKK